MFTNKFSEKDLFEDSDGSSYFFTCSMISCCEPLFDDCESNYEVRDRLESASVYDSNCEDDTESCQLWVHFEEREYGNGFIDRLNNYLKNKENLINNANNF